MRPSRRGYPAAFLLLLALCAPSPRDLRGDEAPAAGGRFMRAYWYEPGLEHGNPPVNGRFRVNAPESVLHPRFRHRREVRGNGMMLIRVDEDLARLSGAELYLELWGGHPGTAGKRVTLNGRSTYPLPENGTAEEHCTHLYPTVKVAVTDLVAGYNAVQFACDRGSSFWGHFIVDNACLRVVLAPDHPDVAGAGFEGLAARVMAETSGETIRLRLELAGAEPRIRRVDYLALYEGYDENGDRKTRDWHGFTKERSPVAIVGSATEPPHSVEWDVSMIPAQQDVSVRAVLHLEESALRYETPPRNGLEIGRGRESTVKIHGAKDLPAPFWSRAGRLRSATIDIPHEPSAIERAEFHVVIWDGGRGEVEEPFRLNGRALPVAGKGRHDVIYRRLDIDPGILRRGKNVIELLSDTEHHGIEVLLPGPAIAVRTVIAKKKDGNTKPPGSSEHPET